MLDKPFLYEFFCMSTKCSVQIYDKNHTNLNNLIKEIEQNTRQLERRYNFYSKHSFLNKTINNRNTSKVKIDKKTALILERVNTLNKDIGYLFDMSVGTYKHCFLCDNIEDFQKCIKPLKEKSGVDSWHLDGKSLYFDHKETRLDLGGVIKEFAVDEAVKILKKHKINSAIVNFGGDLYALGTKLDGQLFSVGVKNPKDKKKHLFSVQIKDQALTTSAHYERNYKIEDKIFSHILNEKARGDILSATIISKNVLMSGIYSTSFMINASINIPHDMKVALIDKDLQIHQNINRTICS